MGLKPRILGFWSFSLQCLGFTNGLPKRPKGRLEPSLFLFQTDLNRFIRNVSKIQSEIPTSCLPAYIDTWIFCVHFVGNKILYGVWYTTYPFDQHRLIENIGTGPRVRSKSLVTMGHKSQHVDCLDNNYKMVQMIVSHSFVLTILVFSMENQAIFLVCPWTRNLARLLITIVAYASRNHNVFFKFVLKCSYNLFKKCISQFLFLFLFFSLITPNQKPITTMYYYT